MGERTEDLYSKLARLNEQQFHTNAATAQILTKFRNEYLLSPGRRREERKASGVTTPRPLDLLYLCALYTQPPPIDG
jgi:hypothetical protein